jgi:hypothetical protein
MRKMIVVSLLIFAAMAAGCNRNHGVSAEKVLVAPTDSHDTDAWGGVVRQGLAMETAKSLIPPYNYVVPSGDSTDAARTRKEESEGLAVLIEQGTLPGSAVGIGGPDPDATADVVIQALDRVTAGRAKGLTIVVVGSGRRDNELRKKVAVSGAELRIKAVSPS